MKNGMPRTDKQRGHSRRHAGFNDRWDAMSHEEQTSMGANLRDVWHIATQPYGGSALRHVPGEAGGAVRARGHAGARLVLGLRRAVAKKEWIRQTGGGLVR